MMVFLNNSTNISLPTSPKPSEELAATIIASASFQVVVMILTIFGNSLVCFSVVSYYRLRSPTNYFVVSLAVSDFLVGVIILPFRITQTLHNNVWPASLGREGCQFWIWMDILCSGASIVNLAGISIDRLLAIKRPLKYREEMTSKRAYLVILLVWVYAFFAACLSFIDWGGQDTIVYYPQCGMNAKIYITIVSFACFFCPLLIVVVCYGLVLHVAIRHALQLQREKDSIAVSFSTETNGNRKDGDDHSEENMPYLSLKDGEENGSKARTKSNTYIRRSKSTASTFNIVKQIKATKTLAIVVGVFIICWFPFFVIYLTFQYCGNECFDERLSPSVQTALLNIFVYVLPVSNSAANPIIYSCFNQEFRQAFLKIFYRMAGKHYKPKPPSWETSYLSK